MSDDQFTEAFLLVPDLVDARSFYEEALGLAVAEEGSSAVTYDLAGTRLKLQADYPTEAFEAFNLERPPEMGRGKGAVVALELAEDVTAVHERVVASNGRALFEPREVDWLEGRMFLATDPVGYTLEIR